MLIKNAFDILQQSSEKIVEFGVQSADLNSTPKQARVISQLNECTKLYTILMNHIILNDDGDAIAGTIGQIDDSLNTLLLRLKKVAQLTNPFPVVPTPLHSFVTTNGNASVLPSPANEGDLLYFHNGSWTNLARGNSGDSLVATPTSITWASQVGNGIPSGGTTGQVLRKIDNTPYNVQWASLSPADIGVTASAAELNILDGALISTAELNTLVGINTGSSLAAQLAAKMSTTLANGNFLVGNGSSIATSVTPTGAVTFNNTGVFSITDGAIVDVDVNSSAAISRSKLASGNTYRVIVNDNTGVMSEAAAIAASRVIVSNANGVPVHSTTSTVTLGFVDATSSIQTQLDSKLTVVLTTPAQGAMLYYNGTNWVNFAVGTAGQVLTSTGFIPQWGSPTANGIPSGGTTNQYLRKINATNYNTEWHTFVLADVTDVVTTVTELNLLSGLTAAATALNNVDISTPLTGLLNNKLDNNLSYHSIWIGGPADTAQQVSAGSDGSVLTIVSGHPVWQTPPSPTGVLGPGSSTDNAISRWNGTSGDAIQNSLVIIDDSGNVSGVGTLSSGQHSILNQAALRLFETGSVNYVGIRAAGTMGADYTITLPAAAPSSNTFLMYDGANYVWNAGGGAGTISGTIAVTQVAYGSNTDEISGDINFTYNDGDRIVTLERINFLDTVTIPVTSVLNGDFVYVSSSLDFVGYINGQWTNITRPGRSNKSATYTISETERNYITTIDTSGGARTIDISVDLSDGWTQTFINTGSNAINFTASGGMTLNAVATSCTTQWGWVTLTRKGSNTYYASGALGAGGGGGGTVTSVAMSVPSFLSVAGSPITTTGTLAVTLATQTANTIFSGPSSGGAATPTFRALVATDIPDLSSIYLTGNQTITLSGDVSGSGTTAITTTLATVNVNVGSFGSATQVGSFTVNAKGLITAASNVTITPAVGSITGLGTGVATALSVNIGTSGSFVVNGGALGTPSSGTLTNATGLPVSTGISGLGTNVATWLATPSWTNFSAAITGTSPFWALTGTSTLTGVATITSNDNAQHVFNGTWTAAGNDEYHWLMNPALTARNTASDTLYAFAIRPTLNAAANTQSLVTLDLTSTYNQGAFSNVANIGILTNGRIQITADSALRFILQNSGSATGMNFYQTTTLGASITMTGSTATDPNALVLRTDRSTGNMIFSTAVNVKAMFIDNSQRVGVGIFTGLTGLLNIGAGTSSLAQMRFSSTTILATPAAGAFEYNGAWHLTKSSDIRFRLGGILNTNNTTTANVGTGEDTLFSYTVAANTLSTDGQTLVARATGRMGASGSNKTIRVRFGSTLLFDSGALPDSVGSEWHLFIEITRTGAATQKAVVTWMSTNTTLAAFIDYTTPTETLSSSNTLLVTGEATSNNEVLGDMFKVIYEEA